MKTGRLEASSAGAWANIKTIIVLEMKVPEGSSFEALKPILPVFLTYEQYVFSDLLEQPSPFTIRSQSNNKRI